MIGNDQVVEAINQSTWLIKNTLADFSDADLLVRPCPGANHAAWQLGHLIMAESGLLAGAGYTALPALPPGFAEKFSKQTAGVDDPAAFPKKDELLALFDTLRGATVAWAKSLQAADCTKPMPENIRGFCPTVGRLALLLPDHTAMHLGQFQVIRRKLGKPILF